MEERDFELLKLLSNNGNITHAAEKLYTSQSALSKRIQLLEKELGVTLFIRSKQGVIFTPEGEEVLKRSLVAASELQLMRENINAMKHFLSGTLRIGISINYAQYKMADILSEFHKKYPLVNLHISTGKSRNIYKQIVQGDIDLAIIRGEYAWHHFKTLIERERICLIHANHITLSDLNQLPYIGRKTDLEFEREINQWFHENGIKTRTEGIFVDNVSTCVDLVERGIGWAIAPEICIQNFKGHIQALSFANGEPFTRSTYMVCSENGSNLPQVKAFIEYLYIANGGHYEHI